MELRPRTPSPSATHVRSLRSPALVRRPSGVAARARGDVRPARVADPRQGRRSIAAAVEIAATLKKQSAPASATIPNLERGDHIRAEFEYAGPQTLILGHFDTVWDLGQIWRHAAPREGGRPTARDLRDEGRPRPTPWSRSARGRHAGRPAPHIVIGGPRRGGRQRHVARRDRGGGAGERAVLVLEPSLPGGAAKTAAKAAASSSCGCTGWPPTPAWTPARGPAPSTSWPARSSRSRIQDLDRGITVNVGVSRAGSRPNVVAAEARALIDVRVVTGRRRPGEAPIRPAAGRNPGISLELRGGIDRPPLERSDGRRTLYNMAGGGPRPRRTSRKVPRGGGRMGISLRRSVFQLLTDWGLRATAPTRSTSTSFYLTFPSARRSWLECSAAWRR